jgi:tetrahydromethanopterin S-methyltransferase subunit B
MQIIFLFTLMFGLTSFSGDNLEDIILISLNFTEEFIDELQDLSSAATNYANDPSTCNCNSYKNAVRDFVDALKSFKGCAEEVGQLAEYNTALSQYESQIDSLC